MIRSTRALWAAALCLVLAVGTACTRVPDDAVATIAVLGDTQMMTEPAPVALAGRFAAETSWLQANAAALDLDLTVQVGDLTNGTYKRGGHTAPATNTLGLTEMEYAKQAMDRLWRPSDGPRVPWTVSLGNHDIDQWCWGGLISARVVSRDRRCNPGGMIIGDSRRRSTDNFDEVFPPPYFEQMPTYGGRLAEASIDDNFHRLTIGRQPWLVVSLMWAPQEADFAWANRVIDTEVAARPDTRVIVVTHAFMNPGWRGDPTQLRSGPAYGSARELYDQVLSRHAQIRLVLSGHYSVPEPSAPNSQCRRPEETTTYAGCLWLRKASVDVPAADDRPPFTFHAVLTDYSYNGDPGARTYQLQPPGDGVPPVPVERRISDNAYLRLLRFDTVHQTIRVVTVTDPSNVAPATPPPPGCAPTSLVDFGLDAVVCAKTDPAYGTTEDAYTLDYS